MFNRFFGTVFSRLSGAVLSRFLGAIHLDSFFYKIYFVCFVCVCMCLRVCGVCMCVCVYDVCVCLCVVCVCMCESIWCVWERVCVCVCAVLNRVFTAVRSSPFSCILSLGFVPSWVHVDRPSTHTSF